MSFGIMGDIGNNNLYSVSPERDSQRKITIRKPVYNGGYDENE